MNSIRVVIFVVTVSVLYKAMFSPDYFPDLNISVAIFTVNYCPVSVKIAETVTIS
jgi:hypothetical protein